MSFILQRAAAFLLEDPATTELLTETAASYARRRNLLIDALADYGVQASGASGLNVWIPTS
nr:GntR family transcriptional regulator [bacterium]